MLNINNGQESACLWRDRGLSDLELLHGVFHRHVFSPHFHQTYVIEIVEQGLDVFSCNGVVHRAPAGSVIFFNPGEVHTGRSLGREPLAYRCLYPSPELMTELVGQSDRCVDGPPQFTKNVVSDPELFTQLLDAHRRLEPGGDVTSGRELLQNALRQAVSRHAAVESDGQSGTDPRADVERARVFMDVSFSERITNDQLTALSGMSQFHFIRMFRRTVGLTPHEYLLNVRVEQARRMLSTGMPIAHAARRSGFYDQSHLNRHFKRITGVTPGQYRQSA